MTDLLQRALQEYGVKEIVGGKHNPRILEYFNISGHDWVKDDELAWCSAFVNAMARELEYESTGKLNARSWLDVGQSMLLPEVGDLVIFWRKAKNSPWGHVGFFINYDQSHKYINVLGGNQSNMVKISPYYRSRLLGFRRLRRLV